MAGTHCGPHAPRRGRDAFGLGLRPPFYREAMRGAVPVGWLELVTENFMVDGGRALHVLDAVREHYEVALHGVSMNLGGTDPLDEGYLRRLEALVRRCEPVRVSDHLCWTRHGGHHLHDLLPLPHTREAVIHVAERISRVQDRLRRRILIENVSSYARFAGDEMPEAEFLREVCERADCLILLDVNNVVVNAHNHAFDPQLYLSALPAARIAQVHLAGHRASGPLRIDTHDRPVAGETWALYAQAVRRFGPVPTMIERDEEIPPLEELLSELDAARRIAAQARAA